MATSTKETTTTTESTYAKLKSVKLPTTKNEQQLDYTPWAVVWGKLLELYPDATERIVPDNNTGLPYVSDGRYVWVIHEVTIDGISRNAMLAVTDANGYSKTLAETTAVDIANTHARALAKACAMHGLGLSLWQKDVSDIPAVIPPVAEQPVQQAPAPAMVQPQAPVAPEYAQPAVQPAAPVVQQPVPQSAPVPSIPLPYEMGPEDAVNPLNYVFSIPNTSWNGLTIGAILNNPNGRGKQYMEYIVKSYPGTEEAKAAAAVLATLK